MRLFRKVLVTCLIALPLHLRAASIESYYSPSDNLEYIDKKLLSSSRQSIDIAAYTFSSFAIIDALMEAARRGIRIRILLDPSQLAQRHESAITKIQELSSFTNVDVRVKSSRDLMHLKSYLIDGQVLRTGSANFTPSGLKRQNNDLLIIRDDTNISKKFLIEFISIFEKARRYE